MPAAVSISTVTELPLVQPQSLSTGKVRLPNRICPGGRDWSIKLVCVTFSVGVSYDLEPKKILEIVAVAVPVFFNLRCTVNAVPLKQLPSGCKTVPL